jgi:hypothetical protein
MCCLLSIPIRDAYYLSRIANDDARNIISGDDRVYIVHDGKVFEYSQKNGGIVESDVQIVHPDYTELVKQKIDEICAGVKYQSNPDKPVTERYLFSNVMKAKVVDMLTTAPDISTIDLKLVSEFMTLADESGVVDHLIKSLITGPANLDWIPSSAVCAIALQSAIRDGGEEAENLKKVLCIADLVRQKVDELRAAATNTNVNTNSVDASTSQENTPEAVVEEQKTENNNSAVTDELASQGNTSGEVVSEPAKIEEPNKGGKKKR